MMPRGARIVSAHMQNGVVCLWAICDERASYEVRNIAIYGTGHELPANPGNYIGTAMTNVGMFVWHVFELPK